MVKSVCNSTGTCLVGSHVGAGAYPATGGAARAAALLAGWGALNSCSDRLARPSPRAPQRAREMAEIDALTAAIAKWGLGYKHHVCAEESGSGVTLGCDSTDSHPGWKADSTSGSDAPIEDGHRRFLVRLR
eukprot:SAG31_NODE_690_length_12796_cov_4.634559_6_plen_131_part_00